MACWRPSGIVAFVFTVSTAAFFAPNSYCIWDRGRRSGSTADSLTLNDLESCAGRPLYKYGQWSTTAARSKSNTRGSIATTISFSFSSLKFRGHVPEPKNRRLWREDPGSLPWLWREPGHLGHGATTPGTEEQGSFVDTSLTHHTYGLWQEARSIHLPS